MEMGAMGTMGMVIRRGLGELGRFLFVFRRRVPVVGIPGWCAASATSCSFVRSLTACRWCFVGGTWDLPVLYLSFATVGTILVG